MNDKVLKNAPLCANVTRTAQAPIYNDLLFEETTSITGSKCYRKVSDVYLLLNQNRLDRQTKEVLVEQIQDSVGSSGLSELRNNYSDDELCEYVKSRHIQSRSELRDYMNYLLYTDKRNAMDREFKEELSKQEEEHKEEKKEEEKTD